MLKTSPFWQPLSAPFIIGVGRSGTTLLRMMLDAHSQLAIPYETHFIPSLVNYPGGDMSCEEFLRRVTTAPSWPNLAISANELEEHARQIAPFSVAEGLRAFYHLYAGHRGKSRWGDKTPPYRNHMIDIQRLLPEARFIHMVRDGRDVALSYAGLWFGPGEDVSAQANFWVNEIRSIRSQAAHLSYFLEVRYESLVLDSESTLRTICNFLDLPFQHRMLDYHRTASERLSEIKKSFGVQGGRPVELERFLSVYERTKSPPDPARIHRWRIEMSRDERQLFETIAGDLLAELGYDTE